VKVRALEWIGLIMTDMLSFLLVGIAFLYTFTEPVQKVKSRQLVQEMVAQQKQRVAALQNRVEALQSQLGKSQARHQIRRAAEEQIYVRLFPGDLIVVASGGDPPMRVGGEELLRLLKKDADGSKEDLWVMLSAELGVTYDQLTSLAEKMIENEKVHVRFGW
jgi:hypothetical protein